MDWFFSIFRRKSKVASERALMDDKDKEVLREYEVLTSLQERAEQVLKLAKESPDSATRSELLDNVSLNFPPSLIQEPISSRTLSSGGTWRLGLDDTRRYLYSTNNDGLGIVAVYDLQSSTNEPVRWFYCNNIYKVRGIAVGGGKRRVCGEDDDEEQEEEEEESESFIYVSGDHMVHKYSQDGQFLKSFGTCQPGSDNSHCNDPNGMRVYKDEVYVCDSLNERILILSLDLEYIGCISNKRRESVVLQQDQEDSSVILQQDQVDSPDTLQKDQLDSPDAVSLTSDQQETDGRQEEEEEKSDPEQQNILQHQQRGYGLLECCCLDGVCPFHPYVKHPEDLVFDDKGNLHVVDSGKASITVFDPSLRFQRFIQLPALELPFPVSMCLFENCYYISDFKLGHVVVISMLGNIQHKFAVQSDEKETAGFVLIESRERQSPLGLSIDNTGLVYVSNTHREQIWVY